MEDKTIEVGSNEKNHVIYKIIKYTGIIQIFNSIIKKGNLRESIINSYWRFISWELISTRKKRYSIKKYSNITEIKHKKKQRYNTY